VVEDHAKLAMTMAVGLRHAGMAVDVVFDGHDALEHLAVTAYDVVVLDRDIPGVHGDDVCKALVAQGSPSRVLMLTAAGSVEDRVEGLGIGADDDLARLTRGAASMAPRTGLQPPLAPAERTLPTYRALLLSVLPLGRPVRRRDLRPDRPGPAPYQPSRGPGPKDFSPP
jgi:CheY-like chemotaxis protein